jgi:hypothetical protein
MVDLPNDSCNDIPIAIPTAIPIEYINTSNLNDELLTRSNRAMCIDCKGQFTRQDADKMSAKYFRCRSCHQVLLLNSMLLSCSIC